MIWARKYSRVASCHCEPSCNTQSTVKESLLEKRKRAGFLQGQPQAPGQLPPHSPPCCTRGAKAAPLQAPYSRLCPAAPRRPQTSPAAVHAVPAVRAASQASPCSSRKCSTSSAAMQPAIKKGRPQWQWRSRRLLQLLSHGRDQHYSASHAWRQELCRPIGALPPASLAQKQTRTKSAPEPAAVMACRHFLSWTSPAANTPAPGPVNQGNSIQFCGIGW